MFIRLNDVYMLDKVFTRLLKFFCLTGGLLAASVSCKGPGEAELAYMRSLSAPGAGIWPDYAGCCVPVNIAPLNFYVLPPHSESTRRSPGLNRRRLWLRNSVPRWF